MKLSAFFPPKNLTAFFRFVNLSILAGALGVCGVLACLAPAILVSLAQKQKPGTSTIDVAKIDYATDIPFNIASCAIVAILVALYAILW